MYETQDELDRTLDAALAKYAAVEARVGLEERVLANLRAESMQSAGRIWWKWGLAGVVPAVGILAVVVVALVLSWRGQRPSAPRIPLTTASHPSISTPTRSKAGTELAKHDAGEVRPIPHAPIHRTAALRSQLATVAATPKLDVFPSPLPLSEQEKILASYVIEDPEHAVLIARAINEERLRDQLEDTKALSSSHATDSEEGNAETTDR